MEFQRTTDEWSTARNNKTRSKLLNVYYAKFKQTRQYKQRLFFKSVQAGGNPHMFIFHADKFQDVNRKSTWNKYL